MAALALPWYVLLVKPRHEKAVARSLEIKGYEQFLPLYEKGSQLRKRRRHVQLPLFPMYVFCRFDPNSRLPVLTIPGVLSIVSFGRIPAAVEDGEVESIQRLAASGLTVSPHPYVEVGELAEVVSGPLRGVQGVLTGYRGKSRLVLSISLLQQSAAVEIEWDSVRRIAPRYPAASYSRILVAQAS